MPTDYKAITKTSLWAVGKVEALIPFTNFLDRKHIRELLDAADAAAAPQQVRPQRAKTNQAA